MTLTIREDQIRELEHSIEQRHRKEFVQQLRNDYPNRTKRMNDQQLWELVDKGYENATELELYEKKDKYRFISLRFMPKELLESPFIQSILIRVLNNFNLSGTKRLDFIYKHVANRNPANTE